MIVAPSLHVETDTSFAETACEDSAGHNDGTFTAPYSLKIALPDGTDVAGMFALARNYWSQNGYQVGTVNLNDFDPRLHATQAGFELVLHLVPSQRMAYIDGGTPCLPEAKH